MSALNSVRKLFQKVNVVVDATKNVEIEVLDKDNKQGKSKDPSQCALAWACKRQHIADGAIIGLTISYLINGSVATRYQTSGTVGREITSFDRHHDFKQGKYLLSKVVKTIRLGVKHRGGKRSGKNGPRNRKVHRTANVRTLRA